MRYNDAYIDKQVVTDVDDEPVNLEEVKRHLNMLFDSEGSFQFEDDDTYLIDLIGQSREAIEEYCGISLAPKTIKVIVRNECGNVEIPWGPVAEIENVKDKDGNDVTYTIRGNQFKWIESPCSCYLELTYESGYGHDNTMPIPKGLKRALLEEIAFRYQHRGEEMNQYSDQQIGICQGALNLAAPFKRRAILA